jgi:hypothetical protein
MESVRNYVDSHSGCRRRLRRFGLFPQTTCFYIGDSKMPKMTVRCGGSAESADIFRSFSFCSAWRRLAQFCSKKLTDRRSDREQSFNFANLTKPMEKRQSSQLSYAFGCERRIPTN